MLCFLKSLANLVVTIITHRLLIHTRDLWPCCIIVQALDSLLMRDFTHRHVTGRPFTAVALVHL